MKLIAYFCLLIIALATPLLSASFQTYTFPAGYSVRAINSSGQVIGAANNQAFLWTRAGGFQFLGSLGGGTSVPYAINDGGEVVGASTLPNNASHAFFWTPADGMQDLGSLLGGNSDAIAINTSGQVAGNTWTPDGSVIHAFLWSQATGLVDVGTAEGYSYSQSNTLNNNGEITGDLWTQDGPTYAFRWTLSTGIQALPALGGSMSAPLAINDNGQIAGYSATAEGFWHAALWASDGNIQDLGTLPGDTMSWAVQVNNAGHIAGDSWGNPKSKSLSDRSFFWTPEAGMTDIGTFAGPNTRISSLNNHDQIVGNDRGDGGGVYLWTPSLGLQKIASGIFNPLGSALNDAGQFLAQTHAKSGYNYQLFTPVMQVALSSSQNPSTQGQAVTFTASVSAIVGLPPDGEQVTFHDGNKLLGSTTLSSGMATLTTSTLASGTHDVVAEYAGDVNYFPSKSPQVKQVVH